MKMTMGFIQEKVMAFLALIVPFFLRLRPTSGPSSRSHPSQLHTPSPLSATTADEMQPSLPPSPPPSSPSDDLESELLNLLIAQQHQQWQNAILTFCFSFALGISLLFSPTGESNSKDLPASFALLSFTVLLTFALLFVSFFISQKHATTSTVLEKIALFSATTAFCHAITIPFPLNLKFVAWTLFLFSWIVTVICKLLHGTGNVSP